jgi:biotin synthase
MDRKEIEKLLDAPLLEVMSRANSVRHNKAGDELELCNIMNAKSGLCGEDCKFCAQSLRHKTHSPKYPLKDKSEMLQAAIRAKQMGAHRFDIVTSGPTLSEDELNTIIDAVSEITKITGMAMCASLGKLNEKSLASLKKAGVSRYHHNIETSPRYFSQIVTTHSFQDRVDTIKAAKRAGLEVCSGGIIGMGEDWPDRIEMALTLKELNVDSVPINILVPIKGTPFENIKQISVDDAIRTIAIFRIVLEDKIVKVAAGRESVLRDSQGAAFMAGANGMLIGGYLTIGGTGINEDNMLIEKIKDAWKK